MTPNQRAFLDAQIALAAWRAARDAEAQVAHWLIEGRACHAELSPCHRRPISNGMTRRRYSDGV